MSAKAQIDVKAVPAKSGYLYEVTVREGRSESRHQVTVSDQDFARFGGGQSDPAALVKESFRFLLEREPKESILGSFQLNVIARYFPEYPDQIARRLGRG